VVTLNKSEQRVLEWLMSQGYKKIEYNKSLTFETEDGKKFEVKRAYNKVVLLYPSRIRKLRYYKETDPERSFIVVVDKSLKVIPLSKLKLFDNEECEGYIFRHVGIERASITCRKEIERCLYDVMVRENLDSLEDSLKYLLRLYYRFKGLTSPI